MNHGSVDVRKGRSEDWSLVLEVAFETGFLGSSMSAVIDSPHLFHRSTASILERSPEHLFVAEDEAGLCGYAVARLDETLAGSAGKEILWTSLNLMTLPLLSRRDRRWVLHRAAAPLRVIGSGEWRLSVPPGARLHINLLPRLRGRGVGSRLIDVLLESLAGKRCGTVVANSYRSVRNDTSSFWLRNGFREHSRVHSSAWRPWVGEEVELVCWARQICSRDQPMHD